MTQPPVSVVAGRRVGVAGCYLLHFERPLRAGAQHYVGWALDVDRRVRLHLNGRGARLVRNALAQGVLVELVRVWPSAHKQDERRLKRRGPKSLCPLCSA